MSDMHLPDSPWTTRSKNNTWRSSREDKIAFMRAHRDQWWVNGAIDEQAVSALAKQAQAEGLYGPRTSQENTRWSLREIVAALVRADRPVAGVP
jgi:hypothetical protein